MSDPDMPLVHAPKNMMVYARGVRKNFGQLEVLKGVDIAVPTGSVACIIGPSGSGKSTFLRCINHLEEISSGLLLVEDKFVGYDLVKGRLHVVKPAELSRRRSDIGMVFQNFNLFGHMTALQNLMEAPMQVRGLSKAEARDKAMALLERVGLGHKADSYPRQLSGGQQQRVAIARALAMDPKLLLFDEPTSALDPELVGEVLAVMRDLAQSGITMIVVTHEIGFAREVGDQLVLMDGGQVEEAGDPKEMLLNPQSPRTQAFLSHVL